MRAFIIFTIFCFINNYSLFAQSLDDNDMGCYCIPKQKTNKFNIGDTLYIPGFWESIKSKNQLPSCSISLLDSLISNLKNHTGVKLIINAYSLISKEEERIFAKLETETGKKLKDITENNALLIKKYLRKRGLTNCIIYKGMGYCYYNYKKLKKIPIGCDFGIFQLILSDYDSLNCFSLKPNTPIILKKVFFETNKWEVLPDSFKELNKFAEYLTDNQTISIEISGYTDNVGEKIKNIELSEKRAESIKVYLLKQGVKNKIFTKGFGSKYPISDNKTDNGRVLNRRIEVKLIEK